MKLKLILLRGENVTATSSRIGPSRGTTGVTAEKEGLADEGSTRAGFSLET